MAPPITSTFGGRCRDFFRSRFLGKIREINQHYAIPRVKTGRATSFALLVLRIYLVALIAILLFKFFSLLH